MLRVLDCSRPPKGAIGPIVGEEVGAALAGSVSRGCRLQYHRLELHSWLGPLSTVCTLVTVSGLILTAGLSVKTLVSHAGWWARGVQAGFWSHTLRYCVLNS